MDATAGWHGAKAGPAGKRGILRAGGGHCIPVRRTARWEVGLMGLAALGAGPAALGADAADDTAIPPLDADALGGVWPTLAPHLPQGTVLASTAAEGGGGDHTASANAWALGFAHPTSAISWGAGVGVGTSTVADGPGIPSQWHSVRVVGGIWERLTLDDHLLVVAAPGISWTAPGDGTSWSVPVLGVWLHHASIHTTYAVGVLTIAWPGAPLVLPVAGAILTDGPWTALVTPVLVSADRLLTAHLSLGVATGIEGDSAPTRWEGASATAATGALRVTARLHWQGATGPGCSAEAAWLPVRLALVDQDGHAVLERRLPPGVGAAATLSWTW